MTVPFSAGWARSLQLGGLDLGRDEDGNIKVGFFSEREEILIRRLSLGSVALQLAGVHHSADGNLSLRVILGSEDRGRRDRRDAHRRW